MKFETLKTTVLIILVITSLLLTFGLWNYQPNEDLQVTTNTNYLNEVDLGGKEETKRSIIKPSSIIFHSEGQYYGFSNPLEQDLLFQDMQEWVLSDYIREDQKGAFENDNQVEVIFPNEIPVSVIQSLFVLKENEQLPDWSFRRAYITFNQSYSSLNIYFPSVDGTEQVKFTINNASMYTQLWNFVQTKQELVSFIKYGPNNQPIYIPEDSIEMTIRSLAIETIPPPKLLEALFPNQSLISSNVGEAYFTDGQRGMQVLQNGLGIEYINPVHSNKRNRNPLELIDLSILDVNDHKGWTDDFRLENIDLTENLIQYRMHYDGYPVYHRLGLTRIEQQWRDNERFQYIRPLFKLNNLLGSDNIKLKSGEDVINALLNEGNYDLSYVTDLALGYRLNYLDRASYSVILYPAWFIKYRDEWQAMRFTDVEEMERGGE